MTKFLPQLSSIFLLLLLSTPVFSLHRLALKQNKKLNSVPTDIILTASITENINFGGVVGILSTTDDDVEEEYIYTLVAGEGDADNQSFSIIENELEINTWPNYEMQKAYYIRVRTNDQNGGTFEKALIIPVKEINEAPWGIVLFSLEIAENNDVGSVVSQLYAVDEDTVDSHTYQLVAGIGDEDNTAFTIVGDELRAAIPFDYETKNSYSIRLLVTDKENLSHESWHVITITDQEEPEQALTFDSGLSLRTYPNPAKDYLHLSCEKNMTEIQLVNMVGMRVLVQPTNSKELDLDVQAVEAGVYTVVVYAEEEVYTKRIEVVK